VAGDDCVVHCASCGAGRVLEGWAALLVRDALRQGLQARCVLTPACPGSLRDVAPQAPVLARPAAPQAGRHVGPCPSCGTPLLFQYHYGYTPPQPPVPCPACGTDVLRHALQDWPRAGRAGPMDLNVARVAGEARRNGGGGSGLFSEPPLELAPFLHSAH
jgi:hypothetical protein